MKASRPSSEATIALMVESLSFWGRSARQRPARKPHSSNKRLARRRTINNAHNGRMSRRSEPGMASTPWSSRAYGRRQFRLVSTVQTPSPAIGAEVSAEEPMAAEAQVGASVAGAHANVAASQDQAI